MYGGLLALFRNAKRSNRSFIGYIGFSSSILFAMHLLMAPSKLTLSIFYNAESGKNMQSGLGFSLEVSDVDKLAAFNFDDFEGPDTLTTGKNLLTAKVLRTG